MESNNFLLILVFLVQVIKVYVSKVVVSFKDLSQLEFSLNSPHETETAVKR